ncbi:sigma-54 interaction domain-containing protein [Peribacillus asahii]|uniref:ATPase AAA n=1 Tax=Peribacillus asahii TaxID=228899 RepID=A0A3Q9RPQ1_9BACI|nr:sigma 54-interacting transcriptional regulator [Peribacillus asahii]AZV43944.1 ATPase AAA [Peribacillus asahii]USK83687.1 sigma 54-interacting transcriptional regulator [Peribacillus asahii]
MSASYSEKILEAILASIDEGIHVIDLEGNTIFYNEVAAANDGMKVSEVLNVPLLQAFPSLTEKSSTLLQVIQTGKPIYHKEQSYMNIHGKKIETVSSTLPIYVDDMLIGAVEIAKDYSSLKELSQRLIDIQASGKPKKAQANSTVYTFSDLLTNNPDFQQIISQGKKAAQSSSSILVYGESGVGKELFVQSIHHASPRRTSPFIAQNCAALPESLLESLLFGTAKGSYTGAVERQGLFELANGGTLFLDELQSMPIELQAKLLRVLEDGVVRRIGGTKSTVVDVRVIAAMNVPPKKAIEASQLRPDLYYRLNILSYELPPLRKRPEDIVLLGEHFIEEFNRKLRRHIEGISNDVLNLLLHYHWPGNVRELKHAIEYMINTAETKELTIADVPLFLQNHSPEAAKLLPLREALKETESKLITEALLQTNGNVLQASKLLNVPRQTLQYKIQKYRNVSEPRSK